LLHFCLLGWRLTPKTCSPSRTAGPSETFSAAGFSAFLGAIVPK
jgi:hypothetical protein